MIRHSTVTAVILAASVGASFAQDLAAGEASYKKCQFCHDVGENAKTKLGPPLNGLDGRKAAFSDFAYSDGLKNSGLIWSEETFQEYIKDPRAKIADTKMVFPGIKDEKEVSELWAYLKQFGPDGKKK